MFSNLSYQAFFGLLDEYFESRPHLLANGNGGGSRGPVSPAAPTRQPSYGSGGRTLPPPAPSSSRSPPPMLSPPPSASSGGYGGGEKPDMATRMVMSGLKLGSSGARKGLGMLSNNQQAMDALGRAGAQGMIRSAQAGLGPAKGQANGQGQQDQNPPSPTATMTQTRTTTVSAPPSRRVVQTTQVQVNSGQATVVYDYSSGDSGDLSVQSGQVVNVVEKTSADWWTCEDGSGRQGLVPASYLKE